MTVATAAPHRSGAARTALRSLPSPRDFFDRLAHAGLTPTTPLRYADLVVDLPAYQVTQAHEPLDLSARQVELLSLFLLAPRRVWSRDELHWMCWGDTSPSRRVDVQLCRLRTKTGLDLFRNVRERGWALRALR